ncbi:MAG TPA: DHA2 family efflux MFS transporter permease subunit [Acidimicrobiales bacterium]
MTVTEPELGGRTNRRRWIVVIVLCVGQLMIVLDGTVVNVALPIIQRDLHFSQASLAWVINAYLLTFGGLLLLAGRLGDLIGRRRVFLVGLGAFVVSSVVCGLAPSAGVLVVARFVQGISAAMVSSMVLGIISPMFPEPRERTTALSVYAFVAVGGASLGLVLGGAITELLSWHWIFFINAPVGAAALVLGTMLLEEQPGVGLAQGADFLGALLVTGAPMLAVYGLVNAGSHSWGSVSTVVPLGLSVVLVATFVLVEGRVRTPLIPLRIFRHRNLVSAAAVRTLFPMGAFGMNFLGALYLQHVLGYSALRTGLAFLPSSAMTGIISLTLTPRLVRRFALKHLVVTGLVLITAGLLWFTRIPVHGGFGSVVLPTMILTGAGFGLVFMPSVAIAMSDASADEAGVASGLANVAVQLGASIGVAALATLATSRTAHLLAGHAVAKVALTDGYRLGLLVAAGCTAASLLAAVVLLRSVRPVQSAAAVEVEPVSLSH